MVVIRKPYQGLLNIISFNRHFYVVSIMLVFLLLIVGLYSTNPVRLILFVFNLLMLLPILVSLAVSFYIYDLSGLYKLNWLLVNEINATSTIINIHAGFDETSELLKDKYPEANLKVLDFYDPQKHTEFSIKRARKAYPAYPKTRTISTEKVQFEHESADIILLILV